MIRVVARTDWIGLAINAVGAVMLAVLANLYILLARPFGATEGIPIDQTGPVGNVIGTIVPFVWLFLFAGMGTSFWLVVRGRQLVPGRAWLVVALVALCVGYPFYTGALNQPTIALIGNGVVVAVAALSIWCIWPMSRQAALLLVPVIAWVSLASVALIALITGQRF